MTINSIINHKKTREKVFTSTIFTCQEKSSSSKTQWKITEVQRLAAEVQQTLARCFDDFEGYLNFDEGQYR